MFIDARRWWRAGRPFPTPALALATGLRRHGLFISQTGESPGHDPPSGSAARAAPTPASPPWSRATKRYQCWRGRRSRPRPRTRPRHRLRQLKYGPSVVTHSARGRQKSSRPGQGCAQRRPRAFADPLASHSALGSATQSAVQWSQPSRGPLPLRLLLGDLLGAAFLAVFFVAAFGGGSLGGGGFRVATEDDIQPDAYVPLLPTWITDMLSSPVTATSIHPGCVPTAERHGRCQDFERDVAYDAGRSARPCTLPMSSAALPAWNQAQFGLVVVRAPHHDSMDAEPGGRRQGSSIEGDLRHVRRLDHEHDPHPARCRTTAEIVAPRRARWSGVESRPR